MALLLPLPGICHAEDLLFHFRLALQNDPKLHGSESNSNAVHEKLSQAKAAFYPTLSASAARNRIEEKVSTESFNFSHPPGKAAYTGVEYRLNLSQTIYNPALSASWRMANSDLLQAQTEYAATRQELIVRVAQAYFDVLLAQETLLLTRREKDSLKQQLDMAQGQLRAGLSTVTDVNDAQARFKTAEAQEIEAENQLDDKRQALREISGQSPGAIAGLDANVPLLLPAPANVQQWVDTALDQNLSLRAVRAVAQSALEAIAQNRAAHSPTLSMVGTAIRTNADASISGPEGRTGQYTLGLQLNIPIYEGGLTNARVNEATYRHAAAEQEVERHRRAVERAARSAYQGITGLISRIEALRHTVSAANASLEAKTEGYNYGLYTLIDVLNSTRDLFSARRDLAEAHHQYVLTSLQLKLAAGTLNDDDLVGINHWLRGASMNQLIGSR